MWPVLLVIFLLAVGEGLVGTQSVAGFDIAESLAVGDALAETEILGACPLRDEIGAEHNPEPKSALGYYQSPQVQACDEIVGELDPERDSMAAAYVIGALTNDQRALAKRYSTTCLTGEPLVYEPQLSVADIASIKSRTLLLLRKDGHLKCHGFRLNGYFITADHCVEDIKISDEVEVRTLDSPEPLKAVLTMKGGEGIASRPDLDYAILKLRKPLPDDGPADLTWLNTGINGSRLFVTQVNVYTLIAQDVTLQSSLVSRTVTSDQPICRLSVKGTGAYLLNSCHSEHSTSGAAYIQKDSDGRLRFIGVHAGETSGLPSRALADCARSFPNYGIALPLDIVREKLR